LYLVFPFVVAAYRRVGIRVVGWLVAISCIYHIIDATMSPHFRGNFRVFSDAYCFARWMEFAAGMLAASLVSKVLATGRLRSARVGTLLLLSALALNLLALYMLTLAQAGWVIRGFPLRELMLSAAGGCILYASCATSTPLRRLFTNRAIAALGLISYSF